MSKTSKRAITLIVIATFLISMIPIMTVSAITITVDDSGGADHLTIQAAINAASADDTITVAAGTYVEKLNLGGKSLTIIGAGSGSTTVDASGETSYAIHNFGDDTTISGLTLIGTGDLSSSYGFKIASVSDITLEDIKVDNSWKTGIDLKSVTGATLNNIQVTDTFNGFGLMICDSTGVTVTGVTTSGNAWGGVSVQTYQGPVDSVTFTGAFDVLEEMPLLLEQDPKIQDDPSSGYYPITNVDIPDKFKYAVYDLRVDAETEYYKQTYYLETEVGAQALAESFDEDVRYSDIKFYDIATEMNYNVFDSGVITSDDADTTVDYTLEGEETIIIEDLSAGDVALATFWAVGEYVDVKLEEDSNVTSLTITVYYGPMDDVDAEETFVMYWYDGSDWAPCSFTGRDVGKDLIWTTITTTSTPSISQMTGTPFGPGSPVVAMGDFSIDFVTPDPVDYGQVLIVQGSGVTAGNTVKLYWDFATAGNELNTTTGLSSGEFECTVKVPSAYNGNHYIWAIDVASNTPASYGPIPVIPKIKLSPSSGLPKDTVTVKGYGFDVDSDVDITFPDELCTTAGEDETDDLGYFEYDFKVGDTVTDNPYTVIAKDADANWDDATFTVGAAITIDKEVGPAGTIVKVDGRGFKKNAEVKIDTITLENGKTYAVATKDEDDEDLAFSDGTFSVYIVIPSAPEGTYYVTVTDNGIPAKTAKAEFEIDGETSITVSPEYGTPGTVLTVKGYNFTRISGTEVTLELGIRTAKAKTDASGSFTGTIVIPPSDLGEKYDVIANDTRLCHAEDKVLVTIIFLQLSDLSAPVGSDVILMGSGFTDGSDDGQWNATFGDQDLIVTTDIANDQTYFSDTFHVPSLPSGTYPIGVYDVTREITIFIDFTITEQAALSVNRVEIPNGYNLTLKGVNFAEYIDEDEYETTWWLYNSTDAWNLNDYPNVTISIPGAAVPITSKEDDEEGTFTGYYLIPEFLELGSYTINCTTVSNSDTDPEIIQTAEVDIEIVPEEIVINVGGPSYAKGQTITFIIKATLQKDPFDLGIKDPEGSEVFNSTWDITHWKTLGSWYYIPSNLQIDYNTKWLYTLPADATPGTWTYSFWDADKEYKNGTFQVTQLTEIEQLQQDIGEIVAGIEGMGASNTELAALVADLQGASAEAVAAAAAAAAAAGDAQAAAEAGMEAISDVDDTAGDALIAANDAKDAADRAKDAADAGLQAAMDAVAKAQQSVDAANDARDAADANRRQTSGLTGLVYGAIAASLIAALAAIVSLMQISKRIAG